MNRPGVKAFIFLLMFLLPLTGAGALDLTIIGPSGSILKMWDGGEVRIDPTGKYVITGLETGDIIRFSTEIPGRYPAEYAIEMGELSKTFRISPKPTGMISGELKFTDEGFCPGVGVELYFDPEDAYLSIDLYQSFIPVAPMFTGAGYLETRYIMPMIGAGLYLLPFDSFVRINLGISAGGLFGSNLPNPCFAAEMSAGLELEPAEHFIIFAEFNPRLLSPVGNGWSDYSDIFGQGRASSMYSLGSWGLFGFPSTIFGLKLKY